MQIDIQKIDVKKLRKVSRFAEDKKILRTSAYRLLDEDVIDYTVIDGVVFVVLNKKAEDYKKQ